jgi:CDP-diacylglycerol--serine O-phosphatidyltransferase
MGNRTNRDHWPHPVIAWVPHVLTLGNLAFGFIAISSLWVEQDLKFASFCMMMCLLLDFADGLVARWLGVAGDLGKQLDSLADMVSFGVVPGVLAAYLVANLDWGNLELLKWAALLIPVFSAIRLAHFNISTVQTTTFMGVPTPMNSLFWLGTTVVFMEHFSHVMQMAYFPYLYTLLVLFSSGMMVVKWPMMAFKMGSISGKEWLFKGGFFLIPAILLMAWWKISGFFWVYFVYIISSVLYKFVRK